MLGTTLTFQAGTGTANDLTVDLTGGNYILLTRPRRSRPATTAPRSTANTVSCPQVNSHGTVNVIRVEVLDRDDRVVINAPTRAVVDGGADDDRLSGGAGDDTLVGGGGNDTIDYGNSSAGVTVDLGNAAAQNTGGAGTDTIQTAENLYGSPSGDSLTGDSNDNVLRGSDGDDSIDGAGGTDTVDYGNAGSGVTVSLGTSGAQSTGGAGSDTLDNLENLTGSPSGDDLTGNGSDNTIVGGAGSDDMNGSGGEDTASYATAPSGVTVNLGSAGPQDTQGAGTDTLTGFEDLLGSGSADQLTGDSRRQQPDRRPRQRHARGRAGSRLAAGGNGTDVSPTPRRPAG